MAAAISSISARAYNVGQNADINVTPFVDIMLVLLIIFMVSIPTATVSIQMDLPPAEASRTPADPPVVVSLALDGVVYVGERATNLESLPAVVSNVLGPDATKKRVYLRADENVRYSALMRVMNRLQMSGFHRVALVAEEL